LSYNNENDVSVGSAPKLYNEDPRAAESESRQFLETAIEDD
jgi:hypothetical protein